MLALLGSVILFILFHKLFEITAKIQTRKTKSVHVIDTLEENTNLHNSAIHDTNKREIKKTYNQPTEPIQRPKSIIKDKADARLNHGTTSNESTRTYNQPTQRIQRQKTSTKSKGETQLDIFSNTTNTNYFGENNYGWLKIDSQELFLQWQNSQKIFCNGKVTGYVGKFLIMHGAILDSQYFVSSRKGGEKIADVLHQREDIEYFTYKKGAFEIKCQQPFLKYTFYDNLPFSQMLESTLVKASMGKFSAEERNFYILVIRYEYVNLFHTMTDWYNAFLVMNFFNQSKESTNILIADTHPAGGLDSVWSTVFNSSIRLRDLSKRTLFHNLAWNIQGYKSILSPNPISGPLPLHEEFREFFLKSYNISKNSHTLKCHAANILFIWRHNYVAHPRNPSGSVARKISNEEKLVTDLGKGFPDFHISGYQFDVLSMHKQLSLIADTDILIGMHGAGLSHIMFLPKTSGIIELEPSYPANTGIHFRNMAQWRGLPHILWRNLDPAQDNEQLQSTEVPVNEMKHLIVRMLQDLGCKLPS